MAKKAFALTFVLGTVVTLLMFLGALLQGSHFQGLLAGNVRDQQQAQLAAESGLNWALLQLEQDPGWSQGCAWKPLEDPAGSRYRLLLDAAHSVNNLAGLAAVDSRLGPASLPPKTALLLVEGECRGVHRSIEVLLTSSHKYLAPAALATTGRIVLEGQVRVDGLSGLVNATQVEAGLHSNATGSGAKISWNPGALPTSQAVVNGVVSSSGSDASAIDAPGNFYSAANQTQAPLKSMEQVDIPGLIAAASGSDPTTLSANNGTTRLPPGRYRYDGDLEFSGDLVVEPGAELFVNGDLKIVGSLRGGGNLVVGGNTSLKGDAQLGQRDEFISLLSQGNITLEGFGGDAYMAGIASQPALDGQNLATNIGDLWQRTKTRVNNLGRMLTLDYPNWQTAPREDRFNEEALALTNTSYNPLHADYQVLPSLMQALRFRNDEGGLFIKRRLLSVAQLCQDSEKNTAEVNVCQTLPTDANEIVQDFLAGTWNPATQGGILDAITTHGVITDTTHADQQAWLRAYNLAATQIQSVAFDSLGSSVFRGFLYTQGDFISRNEVTIVGALVVRGGDTQLLAGTRLVYVRDLDSTVSGPVGLSRLRILSWILR